MTKALPISGSQTLMDLSELPEAMCLPSTVSNRPDQIGVPSHSGSDDTKVKTLTGAQSASSRWCHLIPTPRWCRQETTGRQMPTSQPQRGQRPTSQRRSAFPWREGRNEDDWGCVGPILSHLLTKNNSKRCKSRMKMVGKLRGRNIQYLSFKNTCDLSSSEWTWTPLPSIGIFVQHVTIVENTPCWNLEAGNPIHVVKLHVNECHTCLTILIMEIPPSKKYASIEPR